MINARFDERLDSVIDEALKRLSDRMQLAYFRGDLSGYLMRIGLADALPNQPKSTELPAAVKKVQGILARRIRRARQKGYLKDYLRQINMVDLLILKKRVRTLRLWALAGGNKRGAEFADDESKKPDLKIVR